MGILEDTGIYGLQNVRRIRLVDKNLASCHDYLLLNAGFGMFYTDIELEKK